MRSATRLFALLTMLALPGALRAMGHGKPQPIPCPTDVAAALATQCPCSSATNHGQYLRCVVHFRNVLRKSKCLTGTERHTMASCAARSTCGKKADFVTCSECQPGTCTNGFCDDGTTACTSSATCPPVVTRCSIKSSAALCAGVVGSGSCCDATCTTTTGSPSGAFLK